MKNLFLAFFILSGAISSQTPIIGWGGLYVSLARTTPVTKQAFRTQDFNIEATAIFPLRNSKWAFHIEMIQPFAHREPLLRIAVARRVF